MPKLKPVWTYDSDGAVLRVQSIHRFGRNQALPVCEWPNGTTMSRLARCSSTGELDQDGRIAVQQVDEYAIRLSTRALASLDDTMAAELDVAPITTARLDLRSQGVPPKNGFHITTRFIDKSGRPTRRTVEGAILHFGSKVERLPEPLFSVYLAACSLASPVTDRDLRFERISALCDVLNDTFGTDYHSDIFLKRLDIAYASHLSVQTDAIADGIAVRPILFGRQAAQQAEVPDDALDYGADQTGSATGRISEAEGLLDKRAHAVFLERISMAPTGPAVKLGETRYVYMPPAILAATRAVLDANAMDPSGREDFIRNPRPYMRDAITRAGIDGDPETLFIPTQEYSARVQGIGFWKAPILPWIVNQPNSWIPERCGIKVGDILIEVEPAEAERAVEIALDAKKRGQKNMQINGQTFEISSSLIEALEQVASLPKSNEISGAKPDLEGNLAPKPEDLHPDYRKHFLVIDENFEDLAFSGRRGTELQVAEMAPVNPPRNLRATLKPYQEDGYNWLVGARLNGHRGALLADDMGLGKTLQTLCAIAHKQEVAEKPRPTLIVAPTALVENWKSEMAQHFRAGAFGDVSTAAGLELKVLRLSDGRDTQTGLPALDTDALLQSGVVITTYETLRDYHLSFAKVPFDSVVFDEIQKLKNPATQISRAAKSVNARFWIGLTGTPVENRLDDLWAITDVLWPGLLGSSKEFNDNYGNGSEEAMDALEAKLWPLGDPMPLPFLVRRMKADRLDDLPKKTIRRIERIMPEDQADTFRAVVAEARRTGPSRTSILQIIQNMRAVSLHPLKVEAARGMEPDDYVKSSARLNATIGILDDIHQNGEKALVFLENLDLQDWLAGYLKSRYEMNKRPHVINGGVPGTRRQEMVDAFQNTPNGFDVMILSPKAGGVGLTITAANHVIHLSRWWNPAVEDQATDRVFRIGQTRPVTVHIPLAIHPDVDLRDGSFDYNLDKLLERKRAMATRLLSSADPGTDSLQELFDSIVAQTGVNRASSTEPDRQTGERTEVPTRDNELSLPDPASDASAKNTGIRATGSNELIRDALYKHTSLPSSIVVAPVGEQTANSVPLRGKTITVDREAKTAPKSARNERPEWSEAFIKVFDPETRPETVLACLEGTELSRVYIQDRYCALPDNRDFLMTFLGKHVLRHASHSAKVTMAYWGTQAHSIGRQYNVRREGDLQAILYEGLKAVSQSCKLSVDFRPSTRLTADLHDRFFVIQTKGSGTLMSFKLTLPHDIRRWEEDSMTGDITIRRVHNSLWNTL